MYVKPSYLNEKKELSEDEIRKIINGLRELKDFLDKPIDAKRLKTRKIHVRELKLEFAVLIQTTSNAFMSCINSDDDNCLYVTQFMDFFQNHISMKEGHYCYLDILSSFCVCDGKGIAQNQRYIGQQILDRYKVNKMSSSKRIWKRERECFVIHHDQVCLVNKDMAAPMPMAAFFEMRYDIGEDDRQLLTEELKLFICLCKVTVFL
ncbi:hypothetical protein LSH36_220g02001 [Paralvinella palmiformis]|uniref:Uncharacterized protein n=1 Tax=Paralvinella palmiformis TaxID=53620 RepID=A0AAD9JN43_9ANNE|nr:hypothetical protein LSH36_220g02001 [Paralvinella palmiformis]